jgi:hypothetical protein
MSKFVDKYIAGKMDAPSPGLCFGILEYITT